MNFRTIMMLTLVASLSVFALGCSPGAPPAGGDSSSETTD